jgi:hypothetical protein
MPPSTQSIIITQGHSSPFAEWIVDNVRQFSLSMVCVGDAFQRLKIDAHELAGLYERETADMFIEAFKNAKVIE